MWSARFEKLKTLFVTALVAETNEFETAREIAYVNERLQNNLLISTTLSSTPFSPKSHDALQVRSQGVAGRPCGAH